MRYKLLALSVATTLATASSIAAQTTSTTTATPGTTTSSTSTTTTTATTNAGAYDALPEGNKKIVSAIYEAQLGSAKDTAGSTLLTRDDIAAMRRDTGWGNVYKDLQAQGYVTEKNLGQAISGYNHSVRTPTTTVVTTGTGDQITVKNKSAAGQATAKVGGGTAKADHGKSTTVTTAGGNTTGIAPNSGKSTVVTTAAGSTAGANAAAVRSGGVSNAGGNGNGQASAKSK